MRNAIILQHKPFKPQFVNNPEAMRYIVIDLYKLFGNQSDQKKFIGNSVVPNVVEAWAEQEGRKLLIAAA